MEETLRLPDHPSHTHRRLILTPQQRFPCQTARPGLTSADMGLVGGLHPNKPESKYSPGKCNGSRRKAIKGNPDKKLVSTSFVEH